MLLNGCTCMTNKIIFKLTYPDGRWEKYSLRKSGTIRYDCSTGGFARNVTPDSLIGILRLKKWTGIYYINVELLKKATGVPFL